MQHPPLINPPVIIVFMPFIPEEGDIMDISDISLFFSCQKDHFPGEISRVSSKKGYLPAASSFATCHSSVNVREESGEERTRGKSRKSNNYS